jgi:predicted RecA/RadA family phage recombinase
MAVTADQLISARIPGTGRLIDGLVEAGEVLYAGTMAFWDGDGFLMPTMTGPLAFAGIVRKLADNSGGADGDIKAELYTEGDFDLPLSGVAQGNVGDLAYATDNYTLTLTSTSNSLVGVIVGVAATGIARVRIDIQKRA